MRRSASIAYIDLLTLALLGFVVFAVLLSQLKAEQTRTDDAPPGQLSVEIRWPDDLDTDVDLWLRTPGDRPVGYSRKNGTGADLLRDDLGRANDSLGLNYENIFTRGLPDGEYVVNLHLYSDHTGRLPVPVLIQVSRYTAGSPRISVWSGEAVLTRLGEEITVLRLVVTDRGVEVSAPTYFSPLRSGGPAIGMGRAL